MVAHGLALLRSVLGRAGFFVWENMKEKHATIKQRRQVADLIAIKEGYSTRQQKHVDAVGLMSDADILNYLADATPAGAVEEIRPDEMPADMFGHCDGLINDFCERFNLDKYNMSPLQWGACCSYVGRWFSSRSAFRILNDKSGVKNNFNKIDAAAASAMLPIWAQLCGIYNKLPLAHDFANFCGLSWDWIYKIEHASGVTSADINLYKKLRTICRGCLDSRLIDSKAAPAGAIFYAKAKEGYQETQTVRHEYIKDAETAASLPSFGPVDAIEDKNC